VTTFQLLALGSAGSPISGGYAFAKPTGVAASPFVLSKASLTRHVRTNPSTSARSIGSPCSENHVTIRSI
jgi:hypothetical protein